MNSMRDKNTVRELLQSFEQDVSSEYLFRNIPKAQFLRDLQHDIAHPNTIFQGENGTCGAAVLCKYLVEEHVVVYVEMALSLYKNGTFTRNKLHLSIPRSMLKEINERLQSMTINSVSAIMQGALTHHQNLLLSYNALKHGSGCRSFMWQWYPPKFIKQLLDIPVKMLLLPPMRTLQAINFSEFFVIGLVHHNKKQLSCGFPNHYIELKSCGEERGYYWTWGENTLRTFANKRLPLKFFIAYLVPRTKQKEED